MNDSDYTYPVVSHWSLDGVDVTDIENAQLKAWHLTLDTNRESYTFPDDLTNGFFAIPWTGFVKDEEIRNINDWDYQFFNILPNQTIEREGEAVAEIAIIGIVGDSDPTFDPPLGSHSPVYLGFPAVNDNPLVATILLLDLDGSGSTPDSDSWVRPGYLVTSPVGPRVRTVPTSGPALADDHDDPLVLVPVPANIGLTFEPGKSPTETRAILCDFYANGDKDVVGGVICTWRCPGK